MKYVAAYLLLSLTKSNPTKEDVTDLLSTVGISPDEARLNEFFRAIEGKDINQIIEEGKKKLTNGFVPAPNHGAPLKEETELVIDEPQPDSDKDSDNGSDSDSEGGFGDLFG